MIYNVIGAGIHLWHGARNIAIVNNTVDGARSSGIVVGSGDSGSSATSGDHILVGNNIVVNSRRSILEVGCTTGLHNLYINNLIYHSGGVRLQHGEESGTYELDPKFVNPKRHDYHLRPDSPAIGAAATRIQSGNWTLTVTTAPKGRYQAGTGA